jgi:tetratricopeptide (TPR) repeat protein
MTKKDFDSQKSAIKALKEQGEIEEAVDLLDNLIHELHNDKNYVFIADLYRKDFLGFRENIISFEVAYALNEQGFKADAEAVYGAIVSKAPENSAALNNLSNIKKERGLIEEAFDLIQRAYEIEPTDEIVSRNYNNLLSIVREREQIMQSYQHSLSYLPKENEFVLQKLQTFFVSAKNDRDFKDNRMPIPKWKLKVMMSTDEQKALSLLDQWLKKGYVCKTGDRGSYGEYIYELNPLLLKELTKVKPKKINPQWLRGIELLNIETLESLLYFNIIQSIEKAKKSIRTILRRDIDELFLNYVMKNNKAVVILSGSIVETLLIYYCEKKQIKDISYQRHNKTISKKLYESDLGDLLTYYENTKLLGDVVVHMGNISRIYRNFVHPGKELREQETLDDAKANMCFVSTLEILKRICT